MLFVQHAHDIRPRTSESHDDASKPWRHIEDNSVPRGDFSRSKCLASKGEVVFRPELTDHAFFLTNARE